MSLQAILFGVGRINRRTFWLWHSCLLAGGLLLSLLISVAFGWAGASLLPRLLFVFVWFAVIWVWGAQAVRRLHDFGRPAVMAAAPLMLWVGLLMLALILPVLVTPQATNWPQIAFLVASTLLSLGLAGLVWTGLSRGNPTANDYGPPTWINHPDPPGMHPDQEALPKTEAPPK